MRRCNLNISYVKYKLQLHTFPNWTSGRLITPNIADGRNKRCQRETGMFSLALRQRRVTLFFSRFRHQLLATRMNEVQFTDGHEGRKQCWQAERRQSMALPSSSMFYIYDLSYPGLAIIQPSIFTFREFEKSVPKPRRSFALAPNQDVSGSALKFHMSHQSIAYWFSICLKK